MLQERSLGVICRNTYEPQLTFKFDRLNFSVLQTDTDTDPFNQSQTGFVREIRQTGQYNVTVWIATHGLNTAPDRLHRPGLIIGWDVDA